MDEMQFAQNEVKEAFKVFGRTPLNERLSDILEQAIRLSRFRDVKELEDQTGNLLASVFALCNENDWDQTDLIAAACIRINSRSQQYKSLGRKTNVAFLGGSFNPIHLGHIQAAEAVLNASGFIDEVWLIPCNKSLYGKGLVDAEHRLEMCRIASRHDGRIRVCDWEIKNNVSGETHHLLKQFLEDPKMKDYKFHFIIGMDNAKKAPKSWVNWEYVEQAIPFIVVPRKGEREVGGMSWYHRRPHMILQDEGKIMEMSSSQFRAEMNARFDESDQMRGMDEQVMSYINEHELY